MISGRCLNPMRRSSVSGMAVTEGNEEGPSTSRTKEKLVPSYTYNSWKRLRDVCRALQETQEKAAHQKEELDTLLVSEEECRELAEQMQSERVELLALQNRVERQKCCIMTCRMKLIHFNDEKFQKDVTTNQRADEVSRMHEDLMKRKATLSLIRDNLHLVASHLAWRRRKMVDDLMHIYVINLNASTKERLLSSSCVCNSLACIAGLHLPDTLSTIGHSDVEVSAAVGHVVQVLSLLSRIYNFNYQYSVRFFASRSTVTDPVNGEIYPLCNMSRSREKFEEGMSLLNKNISQLRWSFGLTTRRLDKTLPNLQELLLHIVNERNDAAFSKPAFSRSPVNCKNIQNIGSSRNSFTKRKVDLNRKNKPSPKMDLSNLARQASIGSNKTSLLFDSSAIAAVTLASPQENGSDRVKEVSAPSLNSNGIVSS